MFTSALEVFSKVYAVGKIILIIFQNYGIKFDDESLWDLPFHLRSTENVVTSDLLNELSEVIEPLFYCVYARIVQEVAKAELCSFFPWKPTRTPNNRTFVLPEPAHLYRVLLSLKEILDSDDVSHIIDIQQLGEYQEALIGFGEAELEEFGYASDDLLGFRSFIQLKLHDEKDEWVVKWKGLVPIYKLPSPEALVTGSERFLCQTPRNINKTDISDRSLPWVNLKTMPKATYENENKLDHRLATLAKLEGKVVGALRREEGRRKVMDFARERKCTCTAVCKCARHCTNDVELPCPCAERSMRIAFTRRSRERGRQDFTERCDNMCKLIFEGFAYLRRNLADKELDLQVAQALTMINVEIMKERRVILPL
ncbi:hypothetical protein ASPZODRAFT_64399 [Penicilliopsis zonata CBS 506.65]|uniref:Uncharacterized protein n=1 Tax=Penicilliopsis zonata CBS 506.65 TaxID=1073090 RepID=A0A1L9SKZ0_9EURO|nr:hypothetical protein ASPZODRAFT_64399 [Penicilliopsis zonata CBS 506.65]OJJ47932.1 hypothetical protein ASPZODRAFT_64399 [Penicilliopsis zonata CBS 506.65]